MKNRLQLRYHIPQQLPTRDEALSYLKEAFFIGRSNTTNTSLPAEPLVILYNNNKNLTRAKALSSANVLLAIGRGGDGKEILNNEDYFVIDFAKHEEQISTLLDNFEVINNNFETFTLTTTSDIENIRASILEEVQKRENATITLDNKLSEEKTARLNADENLLQKINQIIEVIGEKGDQCEKETVYGYIECALEGLEEEKNRAEDAEREIVNSVNNEKTRATAAEDNLQTNIEHEKELRENADKTLENKLDAEIARAKEKENNLTTELSTLENDLNTEALRAVAKENALLEANENTKDSLAAEVSRAKLEESKLTSAIEKITTDLTTEIARATNKENTIEQTLTNEIARATGKEGELSASLIAETSRATSKENELSAAITAEASRVANMETTLNAEVVARTSGDTALQVEIDNNKRAIRNNKVKSTNKTIVVTEEENGTNIEVNVDNRTILINETGTLSVASNALIQYTGENAIEVSEVKGENKTISLNINPSDKILTNDAQGLLASLSLEWRHADATGLKDEIRLIGKDNTVISSIDVSEFIKDGILNDVSLDTSKPDYPELVFVFNSASGKETVRLSVKDLVEVYSAGNGLQLNENVFSIKIDANSEIFLTVSANGIKLSGIQNAINTAKAEAITHTNTEIASLIANVNTISNSLNEEKTIRLTNDNQIITDYKAADAKIEGDYKTADNVIREEIASAKSVLNQTITSTYNTLQKEYKDADALLVAADAKIEGDYKAADTLLENKISNETKSRTEAITTVNADIQTIRTNLSNEIARATSKETELLTAIGNETTRATGIESEIRTAIATEVTRATNAEAELKTSGEQILSQVTALSNRLGSAESSITTINKTVEDLKTEVKNEDNNIKAAILQLQTSITTLNAELTRLSGDINKLSTDLSNLKHSVITSIVGTTNQIKVTTEGLGDGGNKATIAFADDALFTATL